MKMDNEAEDRVDHIRRLKDLKPLVWSARQRRMLRDAIEHVRRRRD